ncbi:MAG TPA: T9SS type A sorting domain-containing protein, partial [Saprospiraceae bacterium]|nr:T9SS type A sorting domain-containing protein [Saprospiraceae bacterium]
AHGADLNHDGFSDFFVPNEISNDCRVFINDGAGNYSDFHIYPIPNGSRPSTNESADFNADGRLDLAVGNSTGDSITVFLGNGTGGFFSVRNYEADSGVRGLAVADIDGNGDMDIVTTNRTGNSVAVLHNLGDGSFAPPVIIDANSTGETACATADANGDGILDLFVGAHSSGEISLLLGDGNGGFDFSEKTSAGGSGSWMVAVGDVNGDGNVDVAVVNSQSSNVGVIFGDGAGGLSSSTTYPTGSFPIAIDLGDLDGDADLDLMTSNYAGSNWTYWENDGNGTFINRRILNSEDAGSCATFHDRENDGDLDMTGIDEEADLIFLFRNNGTTSTHDELIENTIAVFPNPAESGWYVVIPDHSCYQLQILDLSGRSLLIISCTEQDSNFIPAGIIDEGIYFLKVIDTKNRMLGTHKILLTH